MNDRANYISLAKVEKPEKYFLGGRGGGGIPPLSNISIKML